MQTEQEFARAYGTPCQASVHSGWGAIACPSPAVYRYQEARQTSLWPATKEWWQTCRKHTRPGNRQPQYLISHRQRPRGKAKEKARPRLSR